MTRAWVEIDLGALRRNGETMARRARVPIVPMIKADAYGLGAVAVARALEPLEPWGYGIATVHEAAELREAGITRRIIGFTPLLGEELAIAHRLKMTPVLGRAPMIELWGAFGAPWHLGIDTGMSRSGVRWDQVHTLADTLRRFPPEGACTHFHSANLDDGSMAEQERRFEHALSQLPARPRVLHAENGVAVERRSPSKWTFVRPGIFLYGSSGGGMAEVKPEPVVHLRARIVDMRTVPAGESVSYMATYKPSTPRRIATLPLGYADGYRRAFNNRGIAILNGQRVRVAGIVTMDMTMIDVTDVPCDLGDVVTLIGRSGNDLLTLDDVAAIGEISPYELLTGLELRLPRAYVGGDA